MNLKIKLTIIAAMFFATLGLANGASAASNVFYSVGQSASDLKTGTPNVTITGGVATFDAAQTRNIGVGDVIVANAISYYISSKTSTTVWNVVTNAGAIPTDIGSTAVTSVKHVYTSLNAAVAGASTLLGNSDLTVADVILNIPCYYDSAADTTQVIISGYTTDATRYIKIYTPYNTTTEANNSQRHGGKWDTTKYILSTSGNAMGINSSVNYTQIIGLQVEIAPTLTYRYGIMLNNSSGTIANCIIRETSVTTANDCGIDAALVPTGQKVYIYNNIIYGFSNASEGMFLSATDSSSIYVYNNTVYNCTLGIQTAYYNALAKNNLAYNNGTDYSGTFYTSSTNNLSKDATAPPYNTYYTNKTLSFVSTISGAEDLHLVSTDTDAINKGADLTSDANLPFTTDIDGQTRNLNSLGWDIGADEAATQIFYSVGQNTTDHKSGGAVTVASGTATFSVAQTATNMGVGDVVTYDSTNKCYLSEKISQTVWKCITATGGVPATINNVPVNSITHAFASLEGAVDANNANGAFDATHLNTKDLVAGNYQLNVPCYYDTGTDSSQAYVQSWTTGSQNYIRIYTPNNTVSEVNQTQRHSGKWDDARYNLTKTFGAGSGTLLAILTSYTKVDGLQLAITYNYTSGDETALRIDPYREAVASNNIVKGNFSGASGTVSGCGINIFSGNKPGYNKVFNNIVYGFRNGSLQLEGIHAEGGGGPTSYIYNNTVYGNYVGIGVSWGLHYLKNNLMNGNTVDFYNINGGLHGSNNNVTQDATSPDGVSFQNKTVSFISTASGVEDFHLAPTDTAAKNSGTDLSADANLPITTDIDGAGRNAAVNAWDIGADETATQIFRSVGPSATTVLGSDTSHARTVTLTSGTATFSNALADNIGVGDAVLIDTGGTDQAIDASDTLLFISGRTDSTHYTLQTHTGAAPSDITVNDTYQIYRAYTSLANAEAGTKNTSVPITFNGGNRDILTNNEQWNIACYANGTTADGSVNIDGWNTGVQDSIKIYTPVNTTEVGISQRHSGKWDDNKYKLGFGDKAIMINDNYVTIDGLQVESTGNGNYTYAISSYPSYTANDFVIKNNLLRSSNTTGSSNLGIVTNGIKGSENIVSNNIIYNFRESGIFIDSGAGNMIYVYNNTIIGGNYGIRVNVSNIMTVKNNIVQGATNGYGGNGTFTAGSDYNISDLASDAPGAHSKNSTTVSFVDATNKDFHLAPTDTAAKNSGTDLSADADLPITTDIDGQTRSASPGWDIGADEAANAVYYSVGQSTADLKTGTPNVSITSGVATFDAAQTGNIGVGDVMIVNAISYYIRSKTSTTFWNVVTVTGATPTDIGSTAVTSIKHVYSSLNSAVSGAGTLLGTTDLYTNNYQINIPCYYDSAADTTAVTVQNYTTAVPNYIKIYTPNNTTTESNNSQRHGGKYDITKYRLEINSQWTRVMTVSENFITIEGLQMYNSYTGSVGEPGCIILSSNGNTTEVKISTNILRLNRGFTADSGYASGVMINLSNTKYTFKVWNNVIYDTYYGIFVKYNAVGNFMIYNNTIHNVGGYGIIYARDFGAGGYLYLKNNSVSHSTISDYSGNATSSYWAAVQVSNNISKDATSPNAGATDCGGHSCRSQTVAFISTTSGSEDFHLASTDTAARNSGADLSADANLAFTTDIDSQTRNQNALGWDIGADEAATQIFYSVGQNIADHSIGTPTVDITNGTATFSVAQTADNMGVGDRVTYNTSSIAYISEKISTTQWKLITAMGGTPANVTGQIVNSIVHEFTSLTDAIGNGSNHATNSTHLNTADLVTNNYQLNIPCYYDSGPETTNLTMAVSYLTSPMNFIKIYAPNNNATEANKTQRHQGKWDDTKYKIDVNGTFNVNVSNTLVDGLQFNIGSSGVYVSSSARNVRLSNLIVTSSYNASYGIRIDGSGTVDTDSVYIYNNVVYGVANGISRYYDGGGKKVYVYNNTVSGTSIAGIRDIAGSTIVAKNNIVQSSTDGYNGTFASGSDYNISDLAADNTGGAHDKQATVSFIDAINKDFHLLTNDTAAKNSGADLSADTYLPFATDIDGETRHSGKWDIGADENNNINVQINRNVQMNRGVTIK